MLTNLLKIKEQAEYLDATDGLAAAVCHYLQKNPSIESDSYTGWKSFVSKNPKRVKK